MSKSRTESVALNATIGLICQIVGIFFSFFSRTVFIKTLGSEYLGINGLFSNILLILSFAELGIGNAIVFSMYKPLADKDTEKIKSLMLLYKSAYRIIGILVAIFGILCIPFLDFIISSKPDIRENIYLIYLLYLFNTVSSYFYTYKKSIITADQKNYIVTLYTQIIQIICVFIQTVALYLTHNFFAYLIIQTAFNFLCNFVLYLKADKMYPYLKTKGTSLEKSEKNTIFKNVKALIMYKFGSIVLNGTDNIIISAMIGVKSVGLASNYILLSSTVSTLLGRILEGFTASVGNLNNSVGDSQKYSVFNKMFLINTWIYGFASIGLLLLIQEVVYIWLGETYMLDFLTMFSIILHFYINGAHNSIYLYRTTLGYFVQGRYTPVIAAVLNVILSVLLCNIMGLSGIFFATSIARFFVIGTVDVYLVYKKTFKVSPIRYYLKYFFFIIVYLVLFCICKFFISYISVTGILGVIIKSVLITVLFNGAMICIFYTNKNFKEIVKAIKHIIW